MTTITFQEIESQRQRWTPVKRQATQMSDNASVNSSINRSIILGLFLEIPVGQWVGQATKKDLPVTHEILKGLGRNINDEYIHLKAFENVAESYNLSPDTCPESFRVAEEISKRWLDLDVHPLLKAASAEVGVFLPNLSMMTILGGFVVSELGANVSRDEQRHGIYNRGVLRKLGISLSAETSELRQLRVDTLDYIFDSVRHKDLGLDKDFFIEESQNLIDTGYSRDLEELTTHFVYKPPFEVSNSQLY